MTYKENMKERKRENLDQNTLQNYKKGGVSN
jgi:hypothetical protein